MILLTVVLTMVGLSACNSADDSSNNVQVPQPTHTRTRLPTTTLEPTITPTFTITPTQTITPLPTPQDDFSGAKTISHGPLRDWNYLITIQLPQPVKGSYQMIMDTNKAYKCEIQPGFEKRLYCHGQQVRYNDEVAFYLIDVDTNVKVFEDKIFIGYIFP